MGCLHLSDWILLVLLRLYVLLICLLLVFCDKQDIFLLLCIPRRDLRMSEPEGSPFICFTSDLVCSLFLPLEIYPTIPFYISQVTLGVCCTSPREAWKAVAHHPDFRQPRVLLACRSISSKVVVE